MSQEAMSRRQRIEKALRLEKTDRVPVSPLITFTYVLRHKGIPQTEAEKNPDRVKELLYTTFTELGEFDAVSSPGVGRRHDFSPLQGPMSVRGAGKGLPDNAIFQYEEKEVMTVEDYDRVLEDGWDQFALELYCRIWGEPADKIIARHQKSESQWWHDLQLWEEKDIPIFLNFSVWSPLMILSCCRSLTPFTLDLYRRPDKVAAVMDVMVDDLIRGAIDLARSGGPRTFQLVLERGSAFYYPLKLFERFEFPYIKKMVEAFVAEGLIPVLHLDTDWTKNLPYFKELPKGKCACELDSTTDIFKAKEILQDHICIKVDVPAAMLSLGTPEQVETYCKKLIDFVGKRGGFILSTGCNCPIDAKFENLKAMIDTAKNYLPST